MEDTTIAISRLINKKKWDYSFHSQLSLQTEEHLKNTSFEIQKLGKLVAEIADGLHSIRHYVDDGIVMLAVRNITEFGLDLSNKKMITQAEHDHLKRSQVQPGDLLVTITGRLGTALVYTSVKPANLSAHVALVKVHANKVNPYYLAAYLNSNFGKQLLNEYSIGSIYPHINVNGLQNVQIVLPLRPIQDRIAQIMQDAYITYQNRLTQAEQIEANAKNYVLDKLGANLSQIEDVKGFIIPNTNFIRQRFDVSYHTFHKIAFFDGFSKEFNLIPLGTIIEDDSYGILTPGDVYSSEHPITYIRVTDMREYMQINLEYVLKVPEEYYRHKRARLKKFDVILAVKGASIASRKSVVFIDEVLSKTIVNGTIFRFQVKKEHNPFYVAVMLDSEILKGQIRKLQISNNAVAYVDKASIHALRLPLPPRSLQDHIAEVMQDTYTQAKSLYLQAENLLTEAKASVERMILGEEDVT